MKNNMMIGACAAILRSPDGVGGGSLTEDQFRTKVLDGVDRAKTIAEEQKSKIAELTTNVGNLDKETKKAFEELQKVRDQGADFEKLQKAFSHVQLQMNREKKMAFGDPVQRISSDPVMKANLNMAVRHFAGKGELNNVIDSIKQKTSLLETSSPGSTIIMPELANEIYDSLQRYGAWSSLYVRRMGTRVQQLPVKTARADGGWITTEGSAITEDTAKAGTSVNATALPIGVLLSVSRELLSDAEFDVTADVMDDFIETFNYYLDKAAFVGDGTNDKNYAGQTGLFNFGTAVTAATGHTKVASLTFEDITACLLAVDVAVLSRPARWWMHPFVLVQMLSIKDSNGRPIFLTALEAPTPNALGSILGFPITPVNVAPAPIGTSASSKVAVFGDPKAYVVGTRQDFEFEASDHYLWANFERSFRGVGRAACKGRKASALAVLTLPAS